MTQTSVLICAVLLLLTGCVTAVRPFVPGVDHPANPNATAGSLVKLSEALKVSPKDEDEAKKQSEAAARPAHHHHHGGAHGSH